MNKQKIESLLAAYDAKAANDRRSNQKGRSMSPETRMILILAVFDDRTAKWTHEFLVEQGELNEERDPKKKTNQIRKISGWISDIRVETMKLPHLCKGLVQPPDMVEARKRWDALNPRPSAEMILSGKWEGTAADYSDLDLSPHKVKKPKVRTSGKISDSANETGIPTKTKENKGSNETKPDSTEAIGGKKMRPAEITRMLRDLPIDKNYPVKAIELMTLRHTESMGKEPSEDEIREWYPGISRTMKEAGISWPPPSAD